ncbi:acyl-CoA N-acyltransferase [Lipomyces doorenjongii]
MSSHEAFYTHSTDLRDLSHPIVVLRSTSEPLTLRVPQVGDLQALIDVLANPENTKNDLSVASLSAEEREVVCRRWLTLDDPRTYMNFIVLDTERGREEPVGIAGLGWIGPAGTGSDESVRVGAAGVMMNPEARRKGYGTEGLKMIIDYGLRELGLVEVRVGTHSSNIAMRRLMEVKLQMEPEVEEKGDRFGNDLLWRINQENWSSLR